MKQKISLLAFSLMALCAGCTTPPHAPAQIPPPPVALVSRCLSPGELPAGATAQDLSEWVMGWIGAYGCERSKRAALIDSWPH